MKLFNLRDKKYENIKSELLKTYPLPTFLSIKPEKSKCKICLFKYRNNNTIAFNELR